MDILRWWAKKKRAEVKADKAADDVLACIKVAMRLHAEGKYPTVRAISIALGHGADWAKPRLECAVKGRRLILREEQVPKTHGVTAVYRPATSSKTDAAANHVGADDIACAFGETRLNTGFDPSDAAD